MNIRFVHTCELEVTTDFVTPDGVITRLNIFKPEDTYDVDIFDNHGHSVDIQFGDGTCIYGLCKTAYEIVE